MPTISISPAVALVDAPVAFTLSGFAPGAEISLRAHMRDDADREWASFAVFRADGSGAVDLATQPPLAGSYAEADAMGIFWSMTLPAQTPDRSPFAKAGLDPTTVHFSAEVAGREVATATAERLFVAQGVTRAPVREAGVVGTFFAPVAADPRPAVLVLGGSSGGLREHQAALIASHGYCALAMAYFAFEGLPQRLANIPLEYGGGALGWLRSRPEARTHALAVVGTSRGAELALLLGATYPQIRAVVAYAPSAVVWGGTGEQVPAWTYRGAPILPMPNRVTPEQDAAIERGSPIAAEPWYSVNLADAAAREAHSIPVERIHGPILLLSGEDDALWPSARMGELIRERLRARGHAYPDEHRAYPGAGHLLGAPYLPTTVNQRRHPALGVALAYGGNPRDQARANVDSWRAVLGFLAEHLG
jgi:dienelactone hydrolase